MKITNLLAIAVLMSLAACAVKDDKASKVALHNNNDSAPTGKVSDGILSGGQPGQIMVTGVAVDFDKVKQTSTLKSGISMTAEGGKSLEGQVAEVADENVPMLNLTKSDSDLTSIDQDKSYAVIGCQDDQVDATRLQGLTKKDVVTNSKETVSVKTKVLFVCGNVDLSTMAAAVKADTLVLNGASLVNVVEAGMMDIGANQLVLEGQNKIETIGMDNAGTVVQAAGIEFNVIKEISGEGSLAITSRGGNVISPTKKTQQEGLQAIHDQNEEAEMKAKSAPANR
jgi:hypothetical protein